MSNDNKVDLLRSKDNVPSSISLSPTTSLDISFLSEEERKALLTDYSKGMVDLSVKAQELNVDSMALKKTLEDLAGTTNDVASSGNSITVTHAQTTKLGRTEIIMGNTDQAQTGKLSKSQTDEQNLTPLYIILGIVGLVIIAILMSR